MLEQFSSLLWEKTTPLLTQAIVTLSVTCSQIFLTNVSDLLPPFGFWCCYVVAAMSSHVSLLILKLPYFMRLSELEEPLEINTQTPSFIYGKSKCTEEKKYAELVGQPRLRPRNLRNEFSVSASRLPISFIWNNNKCWGCEENPCSPPCGHNGYIVDIPWVQPCALRLWPSCGRTDFKSMGSDHRPGEEGAPGICSLCFYLCSSELLSWRQIQLVLRVLEFSPPVQHSSVSCVTVPLQAPGAQAN